MQLGPYFESLSKEMRAVENRVRLLLGNEDGNGGVHWQTDGEHKETIVRQVLRRIAPRNMVVGRGFIVSPEYTSTQIDVLVYDDRFPVLYQDGDLVVIPPAACLAIVEVKSRLTSAAQFRQHVDKQVQMLKELQSAGVEKAVYCGLFYFANDVHNRTALGAHLVAASEGQREFAVNHVALGKDIFFKFWESNPHAPNAPEYLKWHEYVMPNRAFGYFLYNLVIDRAVVPAHAVYFPTEGKEHYLQNEYPLAGH